MDERGFAGDRESLPDPRPVDTKGLDKPMALAEITAHDEAADLTAGESQDFLARAFASVRVEKANGYRDRVPTKIDLLRAYDVPAMNDVVAVCSWGRSGSVLLASFLDWHDGVVMLPMDDLQPIYQFFDEHPMLTLRDKLLAYPTYTEPDIPFFGGSFPISAADYYAGVDALLHVYRDAPAGVLSSSRTFFQFLHVAYSLALAFRPATPRPLMVYSQHHVHNDLADRLVDDFPQARFLHMVRDPISCFDSTFMFHLRFAVASERLALRKYPVAACLSTLTTLMRKSHIHRGMTDRTRAVRFEDLHLNTEGTMRRVAEWLGLPYRSSLLVSTINGTVWVFERNGVKWSGARPEQAKRQAPHLGFAARALIYALFPEEFAAWRYPAPTTFRRWPVRWLTLAMLWLIPTRPELMNAATAFKHQIVPAFRRGDFGSAARNLGQLLSCHITMLVRAGTQLRARANGRHTTLPMLDLADEP